MKPVFLTLFLLLIGDFCLLPSEGAKIFFLIPFATKSEKQLYIPLIDELSLRGHEVVVASNINSQFKSKKVREFLPITYDDIWKWDIDPLVFRNYNGRYGSLTLEFSWMYPLCEKVHAHEEIRKILERERFDLVFKNMFAGQCFNGIIYRMGAPFIIMNTFPPSPDPWEFTGARMPASFVPFVLGPPRGLEKMTIWERLENVLLDIHFRLLLLWDVNPKVEALYRKHLGQDIPSVEEINFNASLIFSNSHYALNAPAPILPDLVEIAGLHCTKGEPLPKDLDEFLSGAKDGFIYFSMGSMLRSQFFSESMRNQILSAFSKLKQRVLWKFEEDLQGLPPNVRIGKWLPQRDILAHPNIQLFITHGGGLSTQEAIYHGVPLVAMPIFADQDGNVERAVRRGIAVKLEALELSEETLSAAVNEVLNNPSYRENAKKRQKYFKDQPDTPMQRAIFWTEYVIRHKGTQHMQSSARQLTFVEYYLLDVIALIALSLLSTILLLVLLAKRVWRLICKGPSDAKDQAKKKQ